MALARFEWLFMLAALVFGLCSWSAGAVFVVILLPFYQESRRSFIIHRQQRVARVLHDVQSTAALARLGHDIPKWLNLTRFESCEFLNSALGQTWVFGKSAIESALLAELQPVLNKLHPPLIGDLSIEKLDLGNAPPVVLGIQCLVHAQRVSLDLQVQSTGKKNVVVRAGKIPVRLDKLEVYGTLRISFEALAGVIPGFRAVSISFTHKPVLNFALAAVHIPLYTGLTDLLSPLITETIGQYLMWPRRLIVPVLSLSEEEQGCIEDRTGEGVLMLRVTHGRIDPPPAPELRLFVRTTLNQGSSKSSARVLAAPEVGWPREAFYWTVADPLISQCHCYLMATNGEHDWPLGSVVVDLCRLQPGQLRTVDLPLTSTGISHPVCRMNLTLQYMPFDKASATRATGECAATRSAATTAPTLTEEGVAQLVSVHVRVLACRNLPSEEGVGIHVACGEEEYTTAIVCASDPVYDTDLFFYARQRQCPIVNFVLVGAASGKTTLDTSQVTHGQVLNLAIGDQGASVRVQLWMRTAAAVNAPALLSMDTLSRDVDTPFDDRNAEELGAGALEAPMSATLAVRHALVVGGLLLAAYLSGRMLTGMSAVFIMLLVGFVYYRYGFQPVMLTRLKRHSVCTHTNLNFATNTAAERAFIVGALQRSTLYTYGERVFWLNQVVCGLWPTLRPALETLLRAELQRALDDVKPTWLSNLRVTELYLGTRPPVITGVRHFKTPGHGEPLVLDFDIVLATDMLGELEVARGSLGTRIAVEDICVQARLRLELDPLVPVLPCFAGLNISFAEFPKFNANISLCSFPFHVKLSSVPGFMSLLRAMLKQVLTPVLIAPSKINLPLFDMPRPTDPCSRGQGVLRVRVLNAKQLPNVDLIGLSDPFCVLRLQQRGHLDQKKQTSVVNNDLNPQWNEMYEFVVYSSASARLRLTVRDSDLVGINEVLGAAELRLARLEPDVTYECAFTLKRRQGTQGSLHAETQWRPFTPPAPAPLAAWVDGSGWSTGVCFAHVISCSGLRSGLTSGDGDVYVAACLGGQQQQTAVKSGTNPLFDTVFEFFVTSPEFEKVHLRVMDANVVSEASLGELFFDVRDVILSNDMAGSFRLLHTSTGTIELKLSYRPVSNVVGGHERMHLPNTLEFAYETEAAGARSSSTPLTTAVSPTGSISPEVYKPLHMRREGTMSLLQHIAQESNDPLVDGLVLGLGGLYARFFGRRGRMESLETH